MSGVDHYLKSLPDAQREALERLRTTILSVAKGAEEKMSYGIPTVFYKGNLVHYAAFKSHLSLFTGSANLNTSFKEDLASFKTSKGTIQFTIEKPLPVRLVKKIVKTRMQENEAKEIQRIANKVSRKP